MADFIWQKNVVRVTALLTCLSVLVILVGVVVIYSQPGESTSPSAVTITAIPLVLLATSALLAFYLGVLIERQNLTEKLPRVTLFRVVSVAVLTILVCPVKNIAFTLLFFLCFIAIVFLILVKLGRGLRVRLAFMALADAVFNLAFAEATRWAGSAGDIASATFNMALFAGLGGTFMPVLQLLALRMPIPKLCQAACIGYGVLTIHSATILLQAIGTEMNFFLNGGGYYFQGPSCVAADVESPLSLVLGMLTSFSTAGRYEGPAGIRPCPDALAGVDGGADAVPYLQVHICGETPLATVLFFVVLGAFFGGLLVIGLKSSVPSQREVPEAFTDAKRRRTLLAGAFMMTGLILIVVFGVMGLECPPEPERIVDAPLPEVQDFNENVTNGTNESEEILSNSTGRLLQFDGMNATGDDMSNTTVQATTTHSPLSNFTAEDLEAAKAVTYTLHGDWTGRCKLPTGEQPNFDSVEVLPEQCGTMCSVRMDCFGYSQDINLRSCHLWIQRGLTGHGTGEGVWSCITKDVNRTRECQPSDIRVVDGKIIEMAPEVRCGCSGAFSRGPWGPVSVAAEQLASVWCTLGMAAPLMCALVGFMVHSLACSMAVEHWTASLHKVSLRSLVGQVRPAEDGEGEVRQNPSIAWREAPREENPKPVAQFGTNRMFSV